jgi:D-alanyl-D-alanine carboxypeptidase
MEFPNLQAMFDDARTAGLQLFVREGYRTREQQKLFDDKISTHRNEGHSKSEARRLAEEWVAVPGTSEIGIAIDINAGTSICSPDAVYS